MSCAFFKFVLHYLFYIINRRTDKQIFAPILFFLSHKNRSIFTKCMIWLFAKIFNQDILSIFLRYTHYVIFLKENMFYDKRVLW